ncbi:MAG: AMP-binding protein [Lentisphaeria bacterium]|nr:AMP-binding protein [Lentisphaeria bacterium]
MNPVFDNTKQPAISSDFPVKVPEYFNFAYDVIDRWAEHDRNKLAMIWTDPVNGSERKLTFHDLQRESTQAANLLLKSGMKRGDKALVLLPRLPEWWILSLAMIRIGVIQCPSPTLLMPPDLKYRINRGGFKMVISDMDNAQKFDEIMEDCPSVERRLLVNGSRENWIDYTAAISDILQYSPYEVEGGRQQFRSDEPMLTIFTSGTSKHPEMVLHCYGYPLGHRVTAELWHGLTEHDLHITMSDTGWAKNLWGNYFGQWITGACLLICDIRGKFHAEDLLPILAKYGVTSFCAPPTMYRMLVQADLKKWNLRDLRSCTSAGEPIHTDTVRLWQEGTGITIREAYGQTETAAITINPPGQEPVPGAMGFPSPGWEIELHDEDGNVVPEGEDGRIAIRVADGKRPAGLLMEYLGSPEKNAATFIGDFYYTGDKARRAPDGRYWFVGRSDDIIKSSGYRIGPSEVEEVLMQHTAVREVAVVGAPDPLRGKKVKAYIVLHEGFDGTPSLTKELQTFVKYVTAPYKYPRDIDYVEFLPKTFSGKIKRDLLRKHAETGEMWSKDTK